MANFYGSYIGYGTNAGDRVPPWDFQGSAYGWYVGGYSPTTQIRRQSFASDAHSDAGDLSFLLTHGYSGHSATNKLKGYHSGNSAGVDSTIIDMWDMASSGNAADVGDLLTASAFSGGHSNGTYVWNVGGEISGGTIDIIQNWAVATNGTAVDHGNLTRDAAYAGCTNSKTHGYTHQGSAGPQTNIIDKHVFATSADATDVGDCLDTHNGGHGNSSLTYGYTQGGTPATDRISKYPFASDSGASDVGNMQVSRGYRAPCSGIDYGYGAGGWNPSISDADKYPFASDSDAADVGNVAGSTAMMGGTQSDV